MCSWAVGNQINICRTFKVKIKDVGYDVQEMSPLGLGITVGREKKRRKIIKASIATEEEEAYGDDGLQPVDSHRSAWSSLGGEKVVVYVSPNSIDKLGYSAQLSLEEK